MVFQQKLLKKEKFMKNIFNNKINKRIINYAGPYISEEDVKFTANSLKKGFYKNYRFYTRLLEKKISKIFQDGRMGRIADGGGEVIISR